MYERFNRNGVEYYVRITRDVKCFLSGDWKGFFHYVGVIAEKNTGKIIAKSSSKSKDNVAYSLSYQAYAKKVIWNYMTDWDRSIDLEESKDLPDEVTDMEMYSPTGYYHTKTAIMLAKTDLEAIGIFGRDFLDTLLTGRVYN